MNPLIQEGTSQFPMRAWRRANHHRIDRFTLENLLEARVIPAVVLLCHTASCAITNIRDRDQFAVWQLLQGLEMGL